MIFFTCGCVTDDGRGYHVLLPATSEPATCTNFNLEVRKDPRAHDDTASHQRILERHLRWAAVKELRQGSEDFAYMFRTQVRLVEFMLGTKSRELLHKEWDWLLLRLLDLLGEAVIVDADLARETAARYRGAMGAFWYS
jgi:hypothetical protein